MVDGLASYNVIKDHLVGFNFPDYGIDDNGPYDPAKSTFGSIDELLPLLYLIKLCVVDLDRSSVNLYGKSAGAGAIVNALGVLNTSTYDEQLAAIGITTKDKKQMIKAIERGLVILNCPLKSIEEISALRGSTPEFEILAKRYAQNNMRPIDALEKLQGLQLHVLLHFQDPDEITGNRDDALFIERLRKVNKGTTDVVIGSDGGHNVYHKTLWDYYKKHYSA